MEFTPMDDDGLGELKQWIQEWQVTGQDYREESKGREMLFGSRAELEALIGEARNVGIKLIVKLLFSHGEAQQRNIDSEELCWKGDQYQIVSRKMAWGV